MHVDTMELNSKSKSIMEDVKDQEVRSPAWIWMACGAFAGLVASCIKLHKPTVKPILGRYSKAKGKEL